MEFEEFVVEFWFQSLIGQLQTRWAKRDILREARVSIPYRLATNTEERSYKRRENHVSIPYRLATNFFRQLFCTSLNQLFQSLIGQLQTLLTRYSPALQLCVSIPYRLATNAVNKSSSHQHHLCFNPLQVSYKLGFRLGFGNLYHRFNPLQVSYKLTAVSNVVTVGLVSIPYRLATNMGWLKPALSFFKRFNPLQVSYKRMQISSEFACLAKFQSLIGQLQTRYNPNAQCPFLQFQSLIGQLQTPGIDLRGEGGYVRFNPLQVSYKPILFP